MLIGDEFRDASDDQRFPVVFPGDGSVISDIPNASPADIDDAVAAARTASSAWAAIPLASRARGLTALADAIELCGDELAMIDVIDNGSPIRVMRDDYRLAVEQIRYFAGLALELRGETIPVTDRDAVDFTLREPFGVVARLVPFNHPLMFAASRIAAPLLAGNAVVLKPSEQTSLSALRLGQLAAEILPPGVLNIVTGTGARAGAPLVVHPDVRRVAFTGSETVGRSILQASALGSIKTVTLELGGKNPLFVFPDADLDAAIAGAVDGMNFTWQGQSCGSTSRLFIHRSVYAEVVAGVAARMSELLVGDPRLERRDVGPVVSQAHYDRVWEFIDNSRCDPRLTLVTGGERIESNGFFVPPTLFSAPDGAHGQLFSDEIFGPVLVCAPFDDFGEAIGLANGLSVGLTASVWTSNLRTALAAARDIHVGYLWVNSSSRHLPGAPFGGMKNSGIGREESLEELESYTQTKNVYISF